MKNLKKKVMTPRDYQIKAVNAVFAYLLKNPKGNPLVVAPTGSGKTHLLAYFCQRIRETYADQKVLIITHTKDIISQDARTLSQYVPTSEVAIYSAGLGQKDTARFTVAGIQSIYRHSELFKQYSIIVVDEAHTIPPSGEGRYRTFFRGLDNPRVIGLTATPFRMGHGVITDGHMFDKIVYNIKVQYLIKQGHLTDITAKPTEYSLNTEDLQIVSGDFSKSDMSRKLDNRDITSRIVKELIKFREVRKAWLIFAIDIDHCEHIAEELNDAGILTAAVHSKLDIDRAPVLDLLRGGHIQAIVSVETLTTGFDAPNIDLVVLLRPTQSPVLHVQMIGRGMRTAPEKENCLVLDFAGNVQRLGPIDDVRLVKHGRGRKDALKGKPITKLCPKCQEILSAKVRKCPVCDYAFPYSDKLAIKADTGVNLLSTGVKKLIDEYDVLRVSVVALKGKFSAGYYLRVVYHCTGQQQFNEYISSNKLKSWWKKMGTNEVPFTIQGAVSRQSEIKRPRKIKVSFLRSIPQVIARIL